MYAERGGPHVMYISLSIYMPPQSLPHPLQYMFPFLRLSSHNAVELGVIRRREGSQQPTFEALAFSHDILFYTFPSIQPEILVRFYQGLVSYTDGFDIWAS